MLNFGVSIHCKTPCGSTPIDATSILTSAPFLNSTISRVDPNKHATIAENSGSCPASRIGRLLAMRSDFRPNRGRGRVRRQRLATARSPLYSPSSSAAISAVSSARFSGLEKISDGVTPAVRPLQHATQFRRGLHPSTRDRHRGRSAHDLRRCRDGEDTVSIAGSIDAALGRIDRRNIRILHQFVESRDIVQSAACARREVGRSPRWSDLRTPRPMAGGTGVGRFHHAQQRGDAVVELDGIIQRIFCAWFFTWYSSSSTAVQFLGQIAAPSSSHLLAAGLSFHSVRYSPSCFLASRISITA